MNLSKTWSLLICTILSSALSGQLQSPDEFLPHKLGEHFTPHHLLVDYYEHVAEESPLVELVQYGTTNQDRPLLVAIVTSQQNHSNLEDIRQSNLQRAGMLDGEPNETFAKAITWLSFSVHGNEAAGSEAAHQVLYELANPGNTRTKEWLDNTVVIIDPSVNPDGYSRYTHWVRNVTMDENNPDIHDIEHNEPWPGGRVNHYLFDLNRDWAWQTQVESEQRMKLYNNWLPHVHADLHEMGRESPYYFAPAAKPYHPYMTEWQRDFQVDIGKNHAKYFDENGWLYFTKEVFDLFYPSYGDTYPMYSGAIGMTYEQGGSGSAGRGVELRNGEKLTLSDRIRHHLTTALSTIEITSLNAGKVLDEFVSFYERSSQNPPGKYKSFAIKKDPSGHRLAALAELLDKQGITYGTVMSERTISGYQYSKAGEGSLKVEEGDLIVSAYQPKGMLAQILLEPSAALEDSITYDITAWSLPYAYGLEAIASTDARLSPNAEFSTSVNKTVPAESYAYIIPRTDMLSVQLISRLLDQDISMRVIPKKVSYNDQSFEAGSVAITLADNRRHDPGLLDMILRAQEEFPADIVGITTGFASQGPDLGSGQINLIKNPKVLTLSGDNVSSYSHGQIKWYFDRVIDYPLTIVDADRISSLDLTKYNVVILPEGWYRLSPSAIENLSSWVSDGGKLIAIGSASRKLMDQDGFSLKRYATDEEESEATKTNKAADLAARYNHYSDAERLAISDYVPGAIFELSVDSSHPLGFGLGDTYFSLRTNSTTFPLQVGMSNVIVHPKENGKVLGFAGNKIKKRLNDSAAFIVESKGRGNVIYMADNPLFRGFWYNGLFLFSNALFIVN